jgi:hypothetical protein
VYWVTPCSLGVISVVDHGDMTDVAHTHGYAVAVRNTAIVVVLGAVIALVLKALDGRLPTIRR